MSKLETYVTVRLTTKDLDRVKAVAKRLRVNPSMFIRNVVLDILDETEEKYPVIADR